MRKNAPLAFCIITLLLFSSASYGQTSGGWGICEFTTTVAMNAFNPSGSNFTCKKAFVQATDEHYRWDGTAWVLESSGSNDNIYTVDGTLEEDRTVTMDGNDLIFTGSTNDVVIESTGEVGIGETVPDGPLHITEATGTDASANDGTVILEHLDNGGSSSIVFKSAQNTGSDFGYLEYSDDASGNGSTSENALLEIGVQNDGIGSTQDDIAIMPSGNLGVGTRAPAARLDVDGGTVRFSDYGGGSQDTGNETYLLGVEADGDVVEVDIGTIENIYTANGTISALRTVTIQNQDLRFNLTGTGEFEVHDNGTPIMVVDNPGVGIGETTPDGPLHITETTGTGASANDGTVILEHLDNGGSSSIVFKSAQNTGSDFGYMEFSDDAGGNGSTSENALLEIGIQNDGSSSSSQDDIAIMPSGNLGVGTRAPAARLDVDGGTVRFSDYGGGSQDTGNETYLLGVEADGDVVEVDLGTIENIYTANGTISALRTVTIQNQDLRFNLTGSGEFEVHDNGTPIMVVDNPGVGIGETTPDGPLHITEATGTGASANDGTVILEHLDNGGSSSIVFKSAQNTGSDFGYMEFSDNASGNGSTSENALLEIGIQNDGSNNSSQDDIAIMPSGNLGVGTRAPAARLDVDGGTVRFSDYGGGSQDTGNETYLLGVEADGDVVEVDLGDLVNIYTADGTLEGTRTVSMGNNDMRFDMTGTGDFEIRDSGTPVLIVEDREVGIGETAPNAPLHITETTGTGASASDGTIILEHEDDGGSSSIVFKSAVNENSDYGYIEFSDDGSGNGSTTENGLLEIGTQNDVVGSFQDDIALMPSGNLGIGTRAPAAKLDVDGGTMRLSDYGGGTYDTGNETYILAVEADGDVVEVDPSTLGGGGADNLGNHIATQNIRLSNNWLSNDGGNEGVYVEADGDVGVGTASPSAPLHVDGGSIFNSVFIAENDNTTAWSRTIAGLTPNIPDGSQAGLFTFGQSDNTREAGHMYFVDSPTDGNEYVSFAIRSGAFDIVTMLGDGRVGIGTNTPAAGFDVDNGSVRFSDYGGGTYIDTASQSIPADAVYMLGVEADGDVVSMNTAKSSKIFYPPALVIDASTTGTNFTKDLHAEYVLRFGMPEVASVGAPAAIPTYGEDELFYYVTDYDSNVFSNVQIDRNGLMTYNIDATPADNCSVMNVVFVVK